MSHASLPARLLTGPIRFYQRFISPALPATCRYYPSCSQYAVEALAEHGALRGSWLTLRRLGRCQPWSKRPHLDPVPPRTVSGGRGASTTVRAPHSAEPNGRFTATREPRDGPNSSSTGLRPTQTGGLALGPAAIAERSVTA